MSTIGSALVGAAGNLIGGVLGSRAQGKMNLATRQHDKKMAKKSAGWAMKDMIKTGRKFGLHPLASIGANAGTFQPTSIQSENYLGDGIADALGQFEQQQMAQRQEQRLEKAQSAQDQLIQSEIEVNKARSRSIIQGMKMAALGGPGSNNTNTGQPPGIPLWTTLQDTEVKGLNPDAGMQPEERAMAKAEEGKLLEWIGELGWKNSIHSKELAFWIKNAKTAKEAMEGIMAAHGKTPAGSSGRKERK